ncbi:MAG TPA: YiiX/YebB-like N1pC/P60 family cysteine hydrolase [Candidatus Melainabacteria bacterium]|nr:YiiX/YebB-like N1pC/P60 family cysteine hydrolase [Candidatus Melainabacteria bacterium]
MADRRKGDRLRVPALRRARRLWTPCLQRLMNCKFPTTGASITESQKALVKSLLRPGDILLKDDCSYPLSQLGARMLGSNWIHSAVYVGDNKIIDCGSRPYVSENDLDNFLQSSSLAVYRPRFETGEDLQSLISFLQSSIGRPFNRTFRLSNRNSFYCTQLIYRALQQMPHPIDLHISYVSGRPAILAGDIENSRELSLVYLSRMGMLRSVVSHVPSFAALLTGAAVFGKIRPQFTVVGALVSLLSLLLASEYMHSEKLKKELYRHAS